MENQNANTPQDTGSDTRTNLPAGNWRDGLDVDEAARRGDLATRFRLTVGPRYANCTLANYMARTKDQLATVAALRLYGREFDQRKSKGAGIVLSGPTGTGKDHLLTALAVGVILKYGAEVRWVNGLDLWGSIRDAIRNDKDEAVLLGPLEWVDVLYVSDPQPPTGAISDHQASMFLRILDQRCRRNKPTWVTMNVKDRQEAETRLGVPLVDRLRDGALCLDCFWPSYRKAMKP